MTAVQTHPGLAPALPFIPETAPFSAEQRAWLNGFLAGVFSRTPGPVAGAAPQAVPSALTPLSIFFGSQTGTSEGLAKKAAKEAGRRGFAPTVVDLAQTDLAKLAHEKNILVITSTFGDGEPPDNAKALWSALATAEPKTLSKLRYSVCGLGDTNYTLFCQCGKDFDQRLERAGAKRVAPRVDCDLDFEQAFSIWLDGALNGFGSSEAKTPALPASHAAENQGAGYSKRRPFPAPLLASRNLNGAGSAKAVHAIEFSLANSGLSYEAGDALGVFPLNCPDLVDAILNALHLTGEEMVTVGESAAVNLRQALTEHCDLGKATAELLDAAGAQNLKETAPFSAKTPPQVLDVVLAYPQSHFTPQAFVETLKKLQPRLYSISSSPKAHPGEVHLTVGTVRYELNGLPRKGVCSTFLNERAQPGGSTIGVFVHHNPGFRPPARGETPMIMVGPGTGIAPFRAFLEERRETGATGPNWLFFGDQHAASDFLYRDELAKMQETGLLTRLQTAFSRDQAEKRYVQHCMRENAAELWSWLEAGAHFYVCGDASRMAKDVDRALHEVIQLAGGKTVEEAAAYVQALKAAKRYGRDVY